MDANEAIKEAHSHNKSQSMQSIAGRVLVKEIDDLRRQRDELVEALKDMRRVTVASLWSHNTSSTNDAIARVDVILARIKGAA